MTLKYELMKIVEKIIARGSKKNQLLLKQDIERGNKKTKHNDKTKKQ